MYQKTERGAKWGLLYMSLTSHVLEGVYNAAYQSYNNVSYCIKNYQSDRSCIIRVNTNITVTVYWKKKLKKVETFIIIFNPYYTC